MCKYDVGAWESSSTTFSSNTNIISFEYYKKLGICEQREYNIYKEKSGVKCIVVFHFSLYDSK